MPAVATRPGQVASMLGMKCGCSAPDTSHEVTTTMALENVAGMLKAPAQMVILAREFPPQPRDVILLPIADTMFVVLSLEGLADLGPGSR